MSLINSGNGIIGIDYSEMNRVKSNLKSARDRSTDLNRNINTVITKLQVDKGSSRIKMATDQLRDYSRQVTRMQSDMESTMNKVDSAIRRFKEVDSACAARIRAVGGNESEKKSFFEEAEESFTSIGEKTGATARSLFKDGEKIFNSLSKDGEKAFESFYHSVSSGIVYNLNKKAYFTYKENGLQYQTNSMMGFRNNKSNMVGSPDIDFDAHARTPEENISVYDVANAKTAEITGLSIPNVLNAITMGRSGALVDETEILIDEESNIFKIEGVSEAELNYVTSNGLKLEATSGKTTTVLGTFKSDTGAIIDELGNVKSLDFGPRDGGFNLLNTPDEIYNELGPVGFWEQCNKPWLDNVIERGDIIKIATEPTYNNLYRINNITGKTELTGFGEEFEYLKNHDYTYDSVTKSMIK